MAARVVRCRHFEHLDEFFFSGARAVCNPETDCDGALIESLGNQLGGSLDLFRGSRPRQRFALQAGIAAGHGDLPGIGMADARAIVNDLAAGPLGVPGVDVLHADFKLERSGDSVARVGRVVFGGLPVLVQIDETGSDHVTGSVEHSLAREASLADGSDPCARDADAANPVKPGFRIDHTAVLDDQVISGLAAHNQGRREKKNEYRASHGP